MNRIHVRYPGDLVILSAVTFFDGEHGYIDGPKFSTLSSVSKFKFERTDVGMVLCSWSVPANQGVYIDSRWFLVFLPNKGVAWFPMSWLSHVDNLDVCLDMRRNMLITSVC